MAVITGTEQSDTLNGTEDADLISGLGGDDVLFGRGGNDELRGGGGDDTLFELDGANDQLFGDDGDDRMIYRATTPGILNVLLDGGAGDDFLEARLTFNDFATMIGGSGRDRIVATGGDVVTIDAGADADLVQVDVTGAEFEIALGAGVDLLVLGGSPFPFGVVTITDFAAGDAGDAVNLVDYFVAYPLQMTDPFAAGLLRLFQAGADAILQIDPDGSFGPFQFETSIIFENVSVSSLTAHNLGGYAPDGSPTPGIGLSGSAERDFLTGHSGNDLIAGNGGDDVLYGADGNDRLEGGDGNDELSGQRGNDELHGGAGNDTYRVDNAGDLVIEASGQGSDQVFASVSWSLTSGAHVETVTTNDSLATFTINLTGNELAQTITGNAGTNQLDGQGGNDTLDGSAGNDLLLGGGGADIFAFAASGDSTGYALRSDGKKFMPDLIGDFETGVDRIDLSAIDAVAGTPANDAFTFIGTAAFTGQAGQLRYDQDGAQVRIFADMDGDAFADFEIIAATPLLQATDFIL